MLHDSRASSLSHPRFCGRAVFRPHSSNRLTMPLTL